MMHVHDFDLLSGSLLQKEGLKSFESIKSCGKVYIILCIWSFHNGFHVSHIFDDEFMKDSC